MPSVYTLGLEPRQMDDCFRAAEMMVDRRYDKNVAFITGRFVAKPGRRMEGLMEMSYHLLSSTLPEYEIKAEYKSACLPVWGRGCV